MKRTIALIFLILVGAVLVYSIARAVREKKDVQIPASIEDIQKEVGIPVTVSAVVRTTIVDSASFDAVIEPEDRASVMANVDSSVSRIHVEEGDEVSAGDSPTLLLELDDSSLMSRREAADAAFQEAQTNFSRAERLLKEGGISQQEFDSAATALQRAKSELVTAEEELDDCRIFAPISGRVSARHVDPGMVCKSGTLLVEIVDASKVKAEIRVPERMIRHITKGMKCYIWADVYGEDSAVQTEISLINPEIDARTRELTVTAYIPPGEKTLLPGMFASARVEMGSRDGVLVVPEGSLQMREGRLGVYGIDKENAARFHPVETGPRENGNVEVVSGVSEGDRVIVEGSGNVAEGSKVVVGEGEGG